MNTYDVGRFEWYVSEGSEVSCVFSKSANPTIRYPQYIYVLKLKQLGVKLYYKFCISFIIQFEEINISYIR